MKIFGFKVYLELPNFLWSNRDPEAFEHTILITAQFRTMIYYFKNVETGFEEFVVSLFGFGLRFVRDNDL